MNFKGGFSIKSKTSKLQSAPKRGFEKVEEEKERAEEIHEVDASGSIIGSGKPKTENAPLVIPCIKVNKWETGNGKRKSKVEHGADRSNKKQFVDEAQDEAVREIMADTNKFLEVQQNNKQTKQLNIPLMMVNQIPEGTETEEGPLKVDIRPESSNLDDYEAVPVDAFGLGMLRGMGWKQKEGIGKNRQAIEEVKVNVRPKGLGLGAIPVQKRKEQKQNGETALTMKIGALVKIIDGPYKDRYGKVIAMNGDLGRVTVKWALGKYGNPEEINEIFTEVVSQKEYGEKGKDISRKAREEYEKTQKKAEKENKERGSKEKKRKRSKDKNIQRPDGTKWVHLGLIVKYVAEKSSKHYLQKFEVREVESRSRILCRNLETDKEYEFHERDLQTVVPKNEGQVVMVLSGSLSGAFGKIISRNKEKERVMLELLNSSKDIERLNFDNVCQFNGSAADFS